MRLTNKAALITGASRGIGREIALRFADEGAAVALAARTRSEIDALARSIIAAGGQALALPADVTSEESVRAAVQATLAAFGRIDILVNSAGILRMSRLWEYSLEDWRQVLDVNVTGVFIPTKAVIPHMIERGSGRVITIASTAGKWGTLYQGAYNASKHAVLGLTRCLALETAGLGIRVNAICPGFVDSPMVEEQLPVLAQILGTNTEDARDRLTARFPIGRFIRLDEIPPLAIFLASDESEGITGQAINIDGGLLFV